MTHTELLAKLEELEKLAEKATPGPWLDTKDGFILQNSESCADGIPCIAEAEYIKEQDAQFIAASREAIPLLCRELRATLELEKELVDVLSELVEIIDDKDARLEIDSFTAQPARTLLAKLQEGK